MNAKAPLKTKLQAAKRSLTVWFSAAVPVLLAVAEALREQLPILQKNRGQIPIVLKETPRALFNPYRLAKCLRKSS